jgi:hypothetical protein
VYLNPFYLKRYGTAVDERIGLCSKCSFFWLGNEQVLTISLLFRQISHVRSTCFIVDKTSMSVVLSVVFFFVHGTVYSSHGIQYLVVVHRFS